MSEKVHADERAEASVLGAVLLADTAMAVIEEEHLQPQDFYWPAHTIVLKAMFDLQARGLPVDVITVADYLERTGNLERAGGKSAIDGLAGAVPAVGNLRRYCQIVREQSLWRQRQRAAHSALDAIEREDEDGHSRAIALADMAERQHETTRVHPADDFDEWVHRESIGLSTPWPKLTEGLGGGLLAGDVTVLGGWPGMGKTIVADMFAAHAAKQGARTHVYMSEMLAAARTARWIAGETSVPYWKLFKRPIDHYIGSDSPGGDKWSEVLDALGRMPFEYERIEGWPVEQICRHIRRHRWEFAVVDTATRIPAKDTQEVQRISGMLADTAREVGCHVLLVLQLNLERCKQPIKPPPLGRDLLGGGSWWRDARNVLFVHRNQSEDDTGRVMSLERGKVYADKATHGDPDEAWVPLTFDPTRMRFFERGEDDVDRDDAFLGHP